MHLKSGEEVHKGDIVAVHFEVTETYATDEFCNIQLKTIDPMYPGDNKSFITLNTKQVEHLVK